MAIQMLPAEPKPDNQIEHEWKPSVDVIQFGDGYTQRHVQGINAHVKTYTMQYSSLTQEERDTIYNFITSRYGAVAFGFHFLNEPAARKFICSDGLRETRLPGQFFNIEFTMQEVNDLEEIEP